MNPYWYMAKILLLVWNPAVWHFLPHEQRRRQLQLQYRTRGIVLHDRALNGKLEPKT